jgi:NAD-dependent DNA ligase
MMSTGYSRIIAADLNDIRRSLGALVGIAQGLVCDRQLNDQEIVFLDEWLAHNDAVAATWPGDVLFARVREVLADGVITAEERSYLLTTLNELVGGRAEQLPSQTHVTALGFDAVDEIQFSGRSFCFTGDFVFGPREACSAAIVRRGGLVSNVTKKLGYLVVGGLGSKEWKHGSFGTKFEKAVQYKRDGCAITIVREDVWASRLGSSMTIAA